MNMCKLLQSKKRGSVLPLAMFMVVMLLIIGTGMLNLGLNSRIFSIRTASQISARSAADAGMTKALYEMNEKLKVKPWDGNSLPLAVNQTLPNCDALFNYTVTGDLASGYTIESIGKAGSAERKVQCTLELHGPFEHAIFANGGIDLENSVTLDWYNYDDDDENMKVGTNSIAADTIILRNSATINGDVVVGPGGDPNEVIELQSSTEITGDTYALACINELSSVTLPSWLQELPSEGTITEDITITTSGKYSGVQLDNSKTITIDGDVTLYIVGDLVLGNSCDLAISDSYSDASLTLYLGGKLEGKNSSAINNLTKDPTKLKIYGLDSCVEIILKNSCDLYGVIYAPQADVIMHNSADMYGSAAANSFMFKNSATFYYDVALRDESEQGLEFVISNWHDN